MSQVCAVHQLVPLLGATTVVAGLPWPCRLLPEPAKRSAVLAIGTANPANCVQYVDWYFRVTKSDHLTGL
ncbi:hypothetical protein EJB05_27072, partial [Eragrostis curvula]